MKQGAYWVNCSSAHIHDPLHGNQSIYMSACSADLQQSNWRRRWGLRLAGGGTERWYCAYKLDNKPPSLFHSLYFSFRHTGSGSKPPFMCGYPSKAWGILLWNSKSFLYFVFKARFNHGGPKRRVKNCTWVNLLITWLDSCFELWWNKLWNV